MAPSDSHSGSTTKTIEYPFGRDVDTLVICVNEAHARKIFRAFRMKARYTWGRMPMLGHRYKKIIVFMEVARYSSPEEQRAYEHYWREQVETKLERDGEIIYI